MCECVCVWFVGIIDFIIKMNHVSPYYPSEAKTIEQNYRYAISGTLQLTSFIVILFSRIFWLSSLYSVETVIVQRIKGVSRNTKLALDICKWEEFWVYSFRTVLVLYFKINSNF